MGAFEALMSAFIVVQLVTLNSRSFDPQIMSGSALCSQGALFLGLGVKRPATGLPLQLSKKLELILGV